MAGLGILLGGLAGAGRGAAQVGAEDQRMLDERTMMQDRARLEEEKTARIEEARAQRQREAGVQQGQDIQSEATRLMNERDAAAINAKYGSTMSAEDAAALRGNEEARKAYGLLAPSRQSDLETRATAAENLGYLEASRETRGQLQTELQNQRQEQQFKSGERRLDLQEERQKQQDEYNRKRESRLDRLAESQVAFQQARANKEDKRYEAQADRELRLATRDALAGVNNQLKSLEKEFSDPMLAPEQKDVIRKQMGELRSVGERYRKALSGAGLEISEAPRKPFNPDDFRLGGQQGGAQAPAAGRAAPAAPAPSPRQSPAQMAVSALDIGIQNTVRDLTAASNRGDRAEVERLNQQLQDQQAAKARAIQ